MIKLLPLILLFSILGGCASTNFNFPSDDKEFAGVWQAPNNQNAILKIYHRDKQIYLLHFESDEYNWEGIGYRYDNKMISIFRYVDINQRGFITFSLIGSSRLKYVSMNPDGSVRFEDYYIRR